MRTNGSVNETGQSAIRALAMEIGENADELAAGMAQYLHEVVPALDGPRNAMLFEDTRASCEANLAQISTMLQRDALPDSLTFPLPARAYVETLVHSQIPLAELLRTYRLGHRWLWDRWAQSMQERVESQEGLAWALEASSDWMFGYVDRIADHLVETYEAERENWVRSAAAVRADTVRAILERQPVDSEEASRRLGYDLGRHHVGLVLSGDSTNEEVIGLNRLEREARQMLATLDCTQTVTVAAGTTVLWAWGSTYEPAGAEALEQLSRRDTTGVGTAVGKPGHGKEGFRRTHEEALAAARIATLTSRSGTTLYHAVELPSLLLADYERARSFVVSELGALAADGDGERRLRATLLLYLQHGGSYVKTARRVGVHHNTIAYRVNRAAELLDCQVGERRFQLETALMLAELLGDAVLTPTPGRTE